MCAVIFPFIRRLFSSFVLTCFLWTTLFQTIAFAEFERVIPEHASLEREAGALKTIRLNIGIQSFDSAADATYLAPLSDGKQLDIYADILQKTTDLFIPFEESLDRTQESLDHIYKGSTYEGIKISEDGIKWTAHGYNYHMHNSGHMSVSANTAGLALSRNLKLSNPHGAIFLEGDLDFDTLSLDTKDVVQHGNLNVRSLTTKVAGKLINSGFMSVSELLFDDIASAERDTAPLPLFINTREGHFEGQDLSISGACMIQNDGQFTAYGKTHFSFYGRVENNGTMTLDDASIQEGILINTGIFKSTAIEGTFKAFLNTGTVDAKGGFHDVVVQAFVNGESGVIRGGGLLTVGGTDQIAVNRGNIISPDLALTTRGSFANEGTGAITVRHLSSEGQLFENEGDVHVKTWDQRARNVRNADGAEFVIDEAATMDSDAFDNQGTLTFNGTLSGRIDNVTNAAGFTTKGRTSLTGLQFYNPGKLRLSDDFRYQGKTFLTTDACYFYAVKPIELITIDPLVLRGRIDLEQGGAFTAPTIDNHAKIRGETGKTTFDGELTNHNKIDVDELSYEGKKLVNKKEAVIEANHYSRTAKLDHLLNQGRLIVRQGGFEAQTIDNERLLSLGNGKFNLSTFNNTSTGRLLALKGMLLDAVSFLNDGEIISREDMLLTSDFSIKDNSLTILRWNPFYPTRKIGRVRTKGDMAVRMRDFSSSTSTTSPMLSGNVAEFLQQNQDNFSVGKDKKITIHAKSFIPTAEIKFGHHVEMHVDDYQNDHYLAAFSALDLFTKTFRNGKSNDEMGSLKTLEPEHVEDQPRPPVPAHKYRMNVTVEGDIDNRYGILFGAGPTEVVSRLGDVLCGDEKVDPIERTAQFHRGDRFHYQSFKFYLSNDSRISSNSHLIIRSMKGKLKGKYGQLFSSLNMLLKTDAKDQDVNMQATKLTCGGNLFIDSPTWQYSNEHMQYRHNFGSILDISNCYSDYFASAPGKIEVLGDLSLHTSGSSIFGTDLFVLGSLFLNSAQVDSNFKTYLNITGFCGWCGSSAGNHGNGMNYTPNIRIGEHFDVTVGSMRFEGNLSSPIINITTDLFSQGGVGSRGPSRMTGIMLENGLLTTSASYTDRLIGGVSTKSEHGFVTMTENLSYRNQMVKRQNAPVLGQAELGFEEGIPFLVDRRFERNLATHMAADITGCMYDRSETDSRRDFILTQVRRAEDYFRLGMFTLADLDNVTKSILFWQRMPEQWLSNIRVPEHYSMCRYTPYAELDQYKGIAGLLRGQRVTINAREAHIDGGAIVQESPLEDIMDEPEEEPIITARAVREDDTDKDVDALPPKTKVRKPKAKTEPHPLELNFGLVDGRAAHWQSDDGINLTIEKGGFLGSKAKRMSIDGGFQDVIERFTMRSKGPIHVKAEHDLCLQAIEAHSDTSILFETSGNLFDIPLMLEGARTTVEHSGKKTVTREERSSTAMTSNYTCKGAVVFKADGRIDTYATKVRAKLLQLLAGEGVNTYDVHNSYSCATQEDVKGRGWFGKDKHIQTMYQVMRSIGADYGDTPTEIVAQRGDIVLTNIKASKLKLDAPRGVVRFLLGRNYESFSRTEQSKNLFWQSQSMHSSEHQTFSESQLGEVFIKSAESVNVEAVRGKTAEYLNRIKEHYHGVVTQTFLDEVHHEINHKVSGPTAACAVVIALAATAATMGSGLSASVGTFLAESAGMTAATTTAAGVATTTLTATGSIASVMLGAGFTAIASQAAVSLASNEGDIAKTVEGLGSKETLKSITTAMLMAGLSGGGTPSTFMGHVSQQTANALYRIAIDSAVHGRADGKGIALNAIAGAIGGKLSAEIGTLNAAGEIGSLTHKVMHALNGAGQAFIVGGTDGMAAGALGASLAVTIAEVMMPTNGITKMDPKDRPAYTEADIQKAQAVSRVVVGMVALGAGMDVADVSMAIMTAITAVDHNCAKSARKAAYLGAEGTEPEDAEVAGISKSGDEEAVAGGHLGFGDNEPASGRMSPTSKGMYQNIEAAQKEIEQAHAAGQKPGFLQNLALFEAQGTFDERQHNKYLSQSAAELMYKTPGVIKAAPGFIKDTAIGVYDFASENPGQAAWMAGEYVPVVGGFMTGGRNAKEWHAGDTTWYWATGETALGFSGFIGKGAKAAVGVIKNSAKVGKGGLTLAKTGDRSVHALDLASTINKAPYNPRAMEHLMHETYGARNVSSSTLLRSNERMVHMAGKSHPVTGIPYDMKGFPIFDDVAAFDVKLPSSKALKVVSDTHKTAATRELAKVIEGNPAIKAKFNATQLADIASGEKTIEGYIWHHHQDIGRMQLIPKQLHVETGHVGENLWRRGLSDATK